MPSRSVAGTVTVRVVTSSGISRARTSTNFHYLAKPTVRSVSTTSGATKGGASVTVSGANFTDVTSVSFGSARSAKVSTLSSHSLRVTVPAHVPGGTKVVVRTRYGTSIDQIRYTYVASPTVSALAPTTGPAAGGTSVTITGTNFTLVGRVTFASTAGTGVKVLSPTELQVTTPAHSAGVADVRVETSYGTSAITPKDQYTYVSAP